MMRTDAWWSCYDSGLKGKILETSFAHPAKYSWGLITRIYRHAREEGWLKKGDLVVDPMAGVAIGGLAAALQDLRWLGVELEERFCALGQGNIALHAKEWLALGKPLPLLVQGDARQLRELIAPAGLQVQCVVSSPPYVDSRVSPQNSGTGNVFWTEWKDGVRGQLPQEGKKSGYSQPSAVISSPPYADGCRGYGTDPHPERARGMAHSEASAKSANAFRNGYAEPQAVISSPTYANSVDSQACGIDWTKMGPATGKRKRGPGTKNHETLTAQLSYQPQAIVSSPPFSPQGNQPSSVRQKGGRQGVRQAYRALGTDADDDYGQSPAQLGAMREGFSRRGDYKPPIFGFDHG